jgi:hypothetical protein
MASTQRPSRVCLAKALGVASACAATSQKTRVVIVRSRVVSQFAVDPMMFKETWIDPASRAGLVPSFLPRPCSGHWMRFDTRALSIKLALISTAMYPELQRSSHTARHFIDLSIPAFEKL